MINMIKNWQGKVAVNGESFESIQSAIANFDFKHVSGAVNIKLYPASQTTLKIDSEASQSGQSQTAEVSKTGEIRITVKKYMTEKSSIGFDFMAKWNNDNPMPMRIMEGVVEKETRGMVYMKLHGLARPTITCYCCGKELTNPVSRHYGIGPICLNKLGIAREIDDIENIKEELVNITWEGWIIKSAITKEEEV